MKKLTNKREAPLVMSQWLGDSESLRIYNKLAEYEDTELSPNTCKNYKLFEDEVIASGRTFNHIIKMLEMDDSGLIPKLHIGDSIYFRVKGMNQFGEHVDFIQTQKITRIDIDERGILYRSATERFMLEDIGKSVFLTREEAEEKLKELK